MYFSKTFTLLLLSSCLVFVNGYQNESEAAWRLFRRGCSGSCNQVQYVPNHVVRMPVTNYESPQQKHEVEPQQKSEVEPQQKSEQTPQQKTTCCDDASCEKWCAREVILLKEVNRYRVRYGLRPFRRNRIMIKGCRRHSVIQSRRGGSCFHASNGFRGECVASGYGTPTAVVAGWMHSPGHRAILLSNAESAGVSGYGTYWTLRTW